MAEITQENFQAIRRIQFLSTKLAYDVLAGAYRSAFKGKGMEFEDVREYVPGDEVRTIDWNVTARMNHPFVKNFREERDLTVLLAVDLSASVEFGSHYQIKHKLLTEIGAVLAFSAIKNNDNVGLVLFSDTVEHYIPPKKGIRHVLRVIRELLFYQARHKGSNLKKPLEFIGKVHRRPTICFLISDFLCHSNYAHEIALLSKRHDLIGIRITDPFEHQFPELNVVQIADLETDEMIIVDSSDVHTRSHFQQTRSQQLSEIESLMKKVDAGFIDIHTDQSYILELRKFFKMRENKRQ